MTLLDGIGDMGFAPPLHYFRSVRSIKGKASQELGRNMAYHFLLIIDGSSCCSCLVVAANLDGTILVGGV